MNDLNSILDLDKKFLDKYNNIVIDENNLDIFIDELEEYDEKRSKLINNLDIDKLKRELDSNKIKDYISIIKENQNNVNDIVNIGQSICRKHLTSLNKAKKINAYSSYLENNSNFIDIVK